MKQNKKANGLVEYLKSEKVAAETNFNKNADIMTEMQKSLTEMAKICSESESLGSVVTGLNDISTTLDQVKESINAVLCRPLPTDVDENIVNIKDELAIARSDLIEKDKKFRHVQRDGKILTDRNIELEEILGKAKENTADSERRSKVRIDRLNEENNRLKKKCQGLTEAVAKKEIGLNKSET